MDQKSTVGQYYFCPMHIDVRQPKPGKCTKCGMDLLLEGTRFGILRHIVSSPLHIVIMVGLMVAVMALVVMMR